MTVLEAIKEAIGYPISDNRAKMTLIKRGLTGTDEVSRAILNGKPFELATADLIFWLITAVDISEGGVSISLSDKKSLKEFASGLYSKWGETDHSRATAKFVNPW